MRSSSLRLLVVFCCSLILSCASGAQSWPFAGQSLAGLYSQPSETTISVTSAPRLAQKWVFTTGGNVSAIPTVSGGNVYFPDWAGNLYAVKASTGTLVWSHSMPSYTGVAKTVSRVSPAVYNGSIIVGDHVDGVHASGAHLLAVSQQTGQLLWITQVDPHPAAFITGSPVVANGVVYVGVSSGEEDFNGKPGYNCCTFRGSVVALNAATGVKLWQTFDMPSNGGTPGGYSGGAIWSTPAIDLARNQLYVGTGNNYTVPASVQACQKANPKSSTCTAADDYFDSIIALDLTTGAVKWGKKLNSYDTWNAACETGKGVCPDPAGQDYDFGSGPNLLGNMVGAMQKSGIYWALNPATGALLWATPTGPHGVIWGSATDGSRIFVGNGNEDALSHRVFPTGQTLNWGNWNALNASNGNFLWQTPDPTSGAQDSSSMTVANGVVFAGSKDSLGEMYAINAATGQILWTFTSGGSVIGAPAIVSGVLYWGSGYRSGTSNNKLYAFTPSSAPIVSVSTPYNNMASNSPVRFTASAANSACSAGISYMRIYTAPATSAYIVHAASLDTTISLSPGIYNTVVQAQDNCGHVGKTYLTVNVVACAPPTGATAIHFCAPASAASVSSPFQVTGSSNVASPTTTKLFVDGVLKATVPSNVFSQLIALKKGKHTLLLQGSDSGGHLYNATETVTVK
jgi:polyvinyl alcohol dehydrogenase (cytochrome)